MLMPNTISVVIDMVRRESFLRGCDASIYKAIVALHARGEGIDLIMIRDELLRDGDTDFPGVQYLVQCAESVVGNEDVRELVWQCLMQRLNGSLGVQGWS